jgi:hypothetical protein
MTTQTIQITKNVYLEFSSMIDTCAGIPQEDNEFNGLFTALDKSKFQNPYFYAELNEAQIKQLIHFAHKQIEYLFNITIPQLNDDQDYKEAGACRYTIKGLQKLINSLTEKVSVSV